LKQRRPDQRAIKARITLAHKSGRYRDATDVCRAILKVWDDAHRDLNNHWSHGTGKKSGNSPPDPMQTNPASALARYISGDTLQNLEGWQMVAAQVLNCSAEDFLEPQTEEESRTQPGQKGFVPMPSGHLALQHLANIEVARPMPRNGANRAVPPTHLEQDLAVSSRLIFNTLRNEPIFDEDGLEIGLAELELYTAFIVVEMSAQKFSLIDAMGADGEVVKGNLRIRYLGHANQTVLFEVSHADRSKTLAGVAQVIDELVRIRSNFDVDDIIAVGFDQNALNPTDFRFFNVGQPQLDSSMGPMRRAVMTEVFRRGLAGPFSHESKGEIRYAAIRQFMRGLEDEDLQ
jgi:hypothetical protein